NLPKELDFARRRFRRQYLGVFGFLSCDGVGFAAAQETPDDAARRREIVNATRMLPAEILGRALEALGLEIAQDEFGVLGTDRVAGIGDVAAAEYFYFHRFARAAVLEQLVDEFLH